MIDTSTTEGKIKVMQAYVDGKTVWWYRRVKDRLSSFSKPLDRDPEPAWDWETNYYYIQPEPMEIWVNESRSGLGEPHYTPENAKRWSAAENFIRTIHFREVIE